MAKRKHARPVAKPVVITNEAEPLSGRLRGWVTQERDIVAPIDIVWESDAG